MINIEEYKNSYYNEFLTRDELWKKYGGTRRESFALFSSMNPKREYKKVMNRSYKKNDSMKKRAENNLKKYGYSCTFNVNRKSERRGNPESLRKARENQKETRKNNPGIWSYNVRKGLKEKYNYSDLYMLLDEDNYEFLMFILEEFGKPTIYDLTFATGLKFSQAQKYVNKFNLRDRFEIIGSELEDSIEKILKESNVKYITHDREQIRPLELDFYIPDFNLAIEVNDTWSHTDESHNKNYHLMKTNKCKEKGIRLIHLFEWEIREKYDIIKSMIQNCFGLSKSINAGSCKSRRITSKEAREFLDKNHRQGYGSSASICYGLYFHNELVSCMTFRKVKNKDEIELYRYCNKLNTSVRMGATRLFEKFKKENEWNTIISYSDIAHTSGKLYEKLGFEKLYETSPNYWYVKDNQILNRISCQKHKLKRILDNFDENLSESENMKRNHYKKIYDCGSIKWTFKNR